MKPQATGTPAFSALYSSLPSAYFHDCYAITLPPDSRTPLELYLDLVSRTPGWIDFLMNLRNRFVVRIGLKSVGVLSGIDRNKPAHDYRIGDQAGIFKLLEIHENEVVLGETDKHLDVKVSVARQNRAGKTVVQVSTIVHVHNALGRAYMFLITPAHRMIAPATVAQLAARPA